MGVEGKARVGEGKVLLGAHTAPGPLFFLFSPGVGGGGKGMIQVFTASSKAVWPSSLWRSQQTALLGMMPFTFVNAHKMQTISAEPGYYYKAQAKKLASVMLRAHK